MHLLYTILRRLNRGRSIASTQLPNYKQPLRISLKYFFLIGRLITMGRIDAILIVRLTL